MALTLRTPPPEAAAMSARAGCGWTVVSFEQVVSVPLLALAGGPAALSARWHPGAPEAASVEPGEVHSLGSGRGSGVRMLVGASDDTAVFAGGGRRWRLIEVIHLRPAGAAATEVQRRVEIQLCGWRRWLAPVVKAYVTRRLTSTLR